MKVLAISGLHPKADDKNGGHYMQSKLISIIVPIYNVEQYLRKCIDSILAQTYKNLEIILVDDGSPDNCGHICDEYQSLDSRIKVIHQNNGGLSAARNAGLDIATGDYIGFVDSDDWIEPNMYEHLASVMEKTGSDIVQCGKHKHENDAAPVIANTSDNRNLQTLGDTLSILEAYFYRSIEPGSPLNLYKAALWEGLRFSVGHYHQDTIIFPELISRCNSLTLTDLKLYHYNTSRNDSISNTGKTLAHIASREKVISVYFQLYKDKPELKGHIAFYICKRIANIKWHSRLSSSTCVDKSTVKTHNQAMHKVFKACFQDAKKYTEYKRLSTKMRIYWYMFFFCPSTAPWLVNVFKRGNV